MKIKVEMEITRDVLENVFVTALEGGSNYWYYLPESSVKKVRKVVSKEKNPYLSTAILEAVLDHGVEVDIHDAEDENELLGTISKATMSDRLQKLHEDDGYRWALEAEMNDGMDASSSDVVFQFITLGEVVYG